MIWNYIIALIKIKLTICFCVSWCWGSLGIYVFLPLLNFSVHLRVVLPQPIWFLIFRRLFWLFSDTLSTRLKKKYARSLCYHQSTVVGTILAAVDKSVSPRIEKLSVDFSGFVFFGFRFCAACNRHEFHARMFASFSLMDFSPPHQRQSFFLPNQVRFLIITLFPFRCSSISNPSPLFPSFFYMPTCKLGMNSALHIRCGH